MKKLKIGDVIEISTAKGLAYAYYTHKNAMYGYMLRVFRRFYEVRPKEFGELMNSEPTFICFFPLAAAVKEKIVEVVGNVPLSPAAQKFPLFRCGLPAPGEKKVSDWWLWDGEKSWRVGEITEEQRKLPIRGIWNDTFLIERLESDWTPETDNL